MESLLSRLGVRFDGPWWNSFPLAFALRQRRHVLDFAGSMMHHFAKYFTLEEARKLLPQLRDGREVFLCWELSENDVHGVQRAIQHRHELDTGYAGR